MRDTVMYAAGVPDHRAMADRESVNVLARRENDARLGFVAAASSLVAISPHRRARSFCTSSTACGPSAA
jgi:hypothetical protein